MSKKSAPTDGQTVHSPPSHHEDQATEAKRSSVEPSSVRSFVDWVVVIVVALVVALGVRTFIVAHFRVEGTSMLDTLHPGDRVFVSKLSYRFGEPGRGDVVVLHELGGERDLIKRVIGLPGETVKVEGCQVYIDDRPLDEPYLSATVRNDRSWCESPARTVPQGSVFVMGDNRPASMDSRYFGPIPAHDIVGRAFVVFWPITDASWL